MGNVLNARIVKNVGSQMHDVSICVLSKCGQPHNGVMRYFCGTANLPICIEDDTDKKIEMVAIETSDDAQLGGFILGGYSTTFDLVTQSMGIGGVKSLGGICCECKPEFF